MEMKAVEEHETHFVSDDFLFSSGNCFTRSSPVRVFFWAECSNTKGEGALHASGLPLLSAVLSKF